MTKLTRNISRYEGACKCGCGFDTLDFLLVKIVQEMCDHFAREIGLLKVTLDISSGCRCVEYNTRKGWAFDSQHLRGRALDHSVREVPAYRVQQFYLDNYPNLFGIGLYDDFTHLDTREGGPARWEV